MGKYKVEENGCLCHLETCICNPWKITKNGEKFVTIFNKETALFIANRLSDYEALEAKLAALVEASENLVTLSANNLGVGSDDFGKVWKAIAAAKGTP